MSFFKTHSFRAMTISIFTLKKWNKINLLIKLRRCRRFHVLRESLLAWLKGILSYPIIITLICENNRVLLGWKIQSHQIYIKSIIYIPCKRTGDRSAREIRSYFSPFPPNLVVVHKLRENR